jgi:hypothetical protein
MDNTVTVTLTKVDLLWVHVEALPRAKSTYVTLLLLWALFFLSSLFDEENARSVSLVLLASFIVALGLLLGIYLASFLFYFLLGSKKTGVLGVHQYRIAPEGLQEETDVNRTLTKWAGISNLIKTKRYLFVQISWYLFHIIPRRAFKSDEDFDGFCSEILNRKNAI